MSIIVDNPIQNNLSVNMPISFTSKDSHKLSEIHKKDVNISIWERSLDNKIINLIKSSFFIIRLKRMKKFFVKNNS